MTERDIERWTREVAEDPGAASFVRLARAYRAQGRRDAAREVVLQGLEHNPEHIGGHLLLALIHVEDGERQRAGDEWQTVLRLEPGSFDASRGLGFLALERNDLAEARRHLGHAAAVRPDDPAVSQALDVLERREAAARSTARDGAAPAAEGAGVGAESGGEPGAGPAVRDPARLFDTLADDVPFLGAVVLDERGLVMAGELELNGARSDLLGALINTAVVEARRATELLGLDRWGGLLLDCDEATVHVAALPDDAVVLMAVRSDAPSGWAVRTAARASALARDFLEEWQ